MPNQNEKYNHRQPYRAPRGRWGTTGDIPEFDPNFHGLSPNVTGPVTQPKNNRTPRKGDFRLYTSKTSTYTPPSDDRVLDALSPDPLTGKVDMSKVDTLIADMMTFGVAHNRKD